MDVIFQRIIFSPLGILIYIINRMALVSSSSIVWLVVGSGNHNFHFYMPQAPPFYEIINHSLEDFTNKKKGIGVVL